MTTKIVPGEVNAAIFSERDRIESILKAGKHNPEMATELALKTNLDVETAKRLLAKAPAANPYTAAMDREGVVGLNAATADFSAPDPKEARKAEIAASMAGFNASQGYATKKAAG